MYASLLALIKIFAGVLRPELNGVPERADMTLRGHLEDHSIIPGDPGCPARVLEDECTGSANSLHCIDVSLTVAVVGGHGGTIPGRNCEMPPFSPSKVCPVIR